MRTILILLALCSSAMGQTGIVGGEAVTPPPAWQAPQASGGCYLDTTNNVWRCSTAGQIFTFSDNGAVAVVPDGVFGCFPNEERVLRTDFSIGCAKDVHPQSWH